MEIVRPEDPGYNEIRRVFNGMIDKHPGAIARCRAAADVVAALALAQEEDLEVAVRSGGHSVAGMSTSDGGLVIDLRPMKAISVDPALKRARVGAGVTWGEFDVAAQEFGLATTGGRDSGTGVAGLTLGGGTGWLDRKYGLACDNLISVDLVTADGRELTATATEYPDLFWALHGGGGNFGVATSFEFQLHPVGPIVLAGILLWPATAGLDVVRQFRDFALEAPDELGCAAVFVTGPPEEFVPEHLRGRPCVAVAICYAGPVEDGENVVKPLRALAEADVVQAMPYTSFQRMFDFPAGALNYWAAEHHDELTDSALEMFVEHALATTSPFSLSALIRWGGAIAHEIDTPLAGRSAAFLSHPFAYWTDPATSEQHISWARRFGEAMKPFAQDCAYLNFIGDEGDTRMRAAFGEQNHRRLARIKATYDPHNVFQLNHNIEPAP